MDKVFIDANIFLEIFLEDSKEKSCCGFIQEAIRTKKELITTDFIVYSCLLRIYRQRKDKGAIAHALTFLSNLPLTIIRPSLDEMHTATEQMGLHNLDFDDSLIVACMESYGLTELASFDKHFDKVKTIKRLAL